MKSCLIALAVLTVTSNAYAFNEADAAKLVKAYSKTVACGLEETKYQAIKVAGKPGVTEEWTDQYVVLWDGDLGCAGGNGTVVPNLSLVEIRGHQTPVVVPTYKTPDLPLVRIKKFSGKDGKVFLEGIGYGEKDHQSNPTKKLSITLKVEKDGFVKQ